MCALHNTGISSLNTHSPLSKSSKMFCKPFHTNCKEQAKKKKINLLAQEIQLLLIYLWEDKAPNNLRIENNATFLWKSEKRSTPNSQFSFLLHLYVLESQHLLWLYILLPVGRNIDFCPGEKMRKTETHKQCLTAFPKAISFLLKTPFED